VPGCTAIVRAHAALIVRGSHDEESLEVRRDLQIAGTNAVHADDASGIVIVGDPHPQHGSDTHEQNNGQDDKPEDPKSLAELGGLRNERQSYDRTRQGRQEHAGAAERFVPRQRSRREQAPVLG